MLNIFRKRSYAADDRDFDTPHRRAGQIWDDRMGKLAGRAKDGFFIAKILAVACIGLTAGMVYTGTTVRTYLYVVEVAEPGQVRTVGQLVNPTYIVPDKVKQYWVREWIEMTRTLSTDGVVVGKNLKRAWAFTCGPAQSKVSPHLTAMAKNAELPPLDVRKRAITVHVLAVRPLSPTTYVVDWEEELFTVVGKNEKGAPEKWTATLTLKEFQWSITEAITDTRDQYPLGVCLYDFTWSPLES
jgi:type IV secretory pathway TrbF-like protein